MGSMALSRRLMTLTGRMSMLRVEIATDPSFIDQVQNDVLEHWRFGQLKLLTGEDKSAAWWILSRQRPMIYVPDVKVITTEHPPADNLPRAGTLLMLRWFGNMLRGSGRAIAAGPQQVGLFIWWCFVDQRISMWTPLIGPLAMICLSFVIGPVILYAYLLWVMVTRLLQALALATARPWVDGLWPILIYVTQIWSALVKTWVLFHLDRQRWTRQNIALDLGLTPQAARLRGLGSAALYTLAMLTLVTAVALATGLLVPARDSVLAGLV
jgi:glycosyltransferase Alg8